MSYMQRLFVHFGPFNWPLTNEQAYILAAISDLHVNSPKIYDGIDHVKRHDHCILVMHTDQPDEEVNYGLFLSHILETLQLHLRRLQNGERTILFLLPSNYYTGERPTLRSGAQGVRVATYNAARENFAAPRPRRDVVYEDPLVYRTHHRPPVTGHRRNYERPVIN